MRAPNRRWLRVFIVLAAGLGMLGWALTPRTQTLTIDNQSGQTIARLEITLNGKASTFQQLPAGAVRDVSYRSRGEAPFALTGRLADEKKTQFHAQGSKLPENSRLTILPQGGVEIRPQEKSSR